jgi:hypothetical protein
MNLQLISLVTILAADGLSLIDWRLALTVLIFYPLIAGFLLLSWNPHWIKGMRG